MNKIFFLFFFMLPAAALASQSSESHGFATTFLWMAVILILAKISSLVEKIGQPSVLGELVIGVLMGNLVLLGFSVFEPIKSDGIIAFLAELGVVILLFQIGLESNMQKMKEVGWRAFLVACVGVVVPFILGTWVAGPWLLPGLSFNTYLFLGATLTATSVGITARVFRDLGKLQTDEAQIVLGAAVIDDVLGLIILAVIAGIVSTGSVGIGAIAWITAKAFLFLGGSIMIGRLAAHPLGKGFSKVHAGVGMKFTLAICLGLLFAYFANVIGLAPIVGAFAAGLILEPVHFRYFKDPKIVEDVKRELNEVPETLRHKLLAIISSHADRHIEEIVEPIGHFLVPIFFVVTGMNVKLETLFNGQILLVALGITVIAFIGKIASGLVAGKVKKSLVGWGMIPRGEVGLIFATVGKTLGVVSDQVFSVIVIVVILSTLIPPIILTRLIRKES